MTGFPSQVLVFTRPPAILVAAIAGGLLAATIQAGTPTPPVTEFAIPTADSSPMGIAAGPDGNLWFTEYQANKIGRITPSGTITEFPLANGSSPYGIAAGPDGNLWFTEPLGNRIGRITPAGVITEFSLPTANSGPGEITAGPDGNLWFTEGANKIGRITPAGVISEFTLPNNTPNSYLRGITAGPDGNVWFTVTRPFCTICPSSPAFVGRITTDGTVTEFNLGSSSNPGGITSGSDGNIWVADSVRSAVWRITPGGDLTPFPVASCCSLEQWNVTSGSDGNLWFVLDYPAMVARVTTQGTVHQYPMPTQARGNIGGITAGPDGNIWFIERSTNQIARVEIGAAPRTNLLWRQTQTGDLDGWTIAGTTVLTRARLSTAVPLDWQVVASGDLDFNGVDDLIWRNTTNGDLAAWLMKLSGVATTAVISAGVPSAWQVAGAADVDRDMKADLFWRNTQTGDVAVWLMDGTEVKFGGPPYGIGRATFVFASGVPLSWQIAGVRDLDGDGSADLLWRHAQSGDVAVWLVEVTTTGCCPMKESISVKQNTVIAVGVPLSWQIAGVGDLDGDGRADILWRNTQSGDVAAWLMNGTTVVRSALVASGVPLFWQIAKVFDISGDGKADLLWRNTQSGATAEWVMDGVAVTQGPLIDAGPPLVWQTQ